MSEPEHIASRRLPEDLAKAIRRAHTSLRTCIICLVNIDDSGNLGVMNTPCLTKEASMVLGQELLKCASQTITRIHESGVKIFNE